MILLNQALDHSVSLFNDVAAVFQCQAEEVGSCGSLIDKFSEHFRLSAIVIGGSFCAFNSFLKSLETEVWHPTKIIDEFIEAIFLSPAHHVTQVAEAIVLIGYSAAICIFDEKAYRDFDVVDEDCRTPDRVSHTLKLQLHVVTMVTIGRFYILSHRLDGEVSCGDGDPPAGGRKPLPEAMFVIGGAAHRAPEQISPIEASHEGSDQRQTCNQWKVAPASYRNHTPVDCLHLAPERKTFPPYPMVGEQS